MRILNIIMLFFLFAMCMSYPLDKKKGSPLKPPKNNKSGVGDAVKNIKRLSTLIKIVSKFADMGVSRTFQIIIGVQLAVFVTSEPPVPGYSYQPPRSSLTSPSNTYLPPRIGYIPPRNSYLPPAEHGESLHHDHHGNDNQTPKSYEFGYSVKDASSGNDYDRREVSDGNVVRGEYRVQLPDGRMQIVTYHADWQTGFHADVRYQGEAKYPNMKGSTNFQGYNYNLPAGFSGSLTGFHGSSLHNPTPLYGPPGYY